jgi:hypothetical protein
MKLVYNWSETISQSDRLENEVRDMRWTGTNGRAAVIVERGLPTTCGLQRLIAAAQRTCILSEMLYKN